MSVSIVYPWQLPLTTTTTINTSPTINTVGSNYGFPVNSQYVTSFYNSQIPIPPVSWENLEYSGNLPIKSLHLNTSAIHCDSFIPLNFPLMGTNYSIFYFDILETETKPVSTLDFICKNKIPVSILALDKNLKRLEFSAINMGISDTYDLSLLLDSTFNIKIDRTDHISSLYSHHFPLINSRIEYSAPSFSVSNVKITRNNNIGITPIMHLSNLILGKLVTPTQQDISNLFETLSYTVLFLNKAIFPKVQPYVSPEYSYLSFDTNKDVYQVIQKHSDYSENGLRNLLETICVEGSNIDSFISLVSSNIGIDQKIIDPWYAILNSIKSFTQFV